MYTIMPEASPGNEPEVRAALDGMDFAGAVVLRPFDRRTEVTSDPIDIDPSDVRFRDCYYDFAWREPWRTVVLSDLRTRKVVSVESGN
jgi:hypothetical protein